MRYRHATLIYNPVSGRRRHVREMKVERARSAIAQQADQVCVKATSKQGEGTRLAEEAIQTGSDLIVVCGGDGTINEVIRGMVGSDAALLPLPAGTANVLAEEVGLPLEPDSAAQMLPKLKLYHVPLGIVRYENPQPGWRHFLLMCGIGVDASIVYHLDTKLKTYLGQGAYFLGSLEQLQRKKFETFQIKVNGKVHESTFTLASKSRRYGGRLVIAPHAHLLSDQFEVVIFHGDSPLRYMGYLAQIATGTLDQFSDVSFDRADRIELSAPAGRRIYIEVDGEFAGRLPAVVEKAQETLTLLLPPEYEQKWEKQKERHAFQNPILKI